MKSEVLVIGAGVAGATVAIQLAKQGKKVTLIERDWSMHHLIIGELIQPSGYACLEDMGLAHTINKEIEAEPVHGYALYNGDDKFVIEYDKTYQSPVGYGFRNGKFLQNLRAEAKALENIDCIVGNVTDIISNENEVFGCHYKNEAGEEIEVKADLTIVCEGAFSMFRKELNEDKKKINSYFLGLVLDSGDFDHRNYGNLVLSKEHPSVIYPISPTEHRVLIDFKKAPRMGEKLKKELRTNFLPDVPKKLIPAFEAAIEKGDFQAMPNHRLSSKPIRKKGVVMIGDTLNMRHPLTGGGMTVAFHDIRLFSKQMEQVNISDSEAVMKAVNYFYDHRADEIASINILADALYRVVKDPQLAEAVYAYLGRGGKYASEPLQLLSGASKNKNMLLRHFSAVAVYGARKNMKSFSWSDIKKSNKMMRNAIHVISPLLMTEKPSLFQKMAIKSYALVDRKVEL